jgi:hypothetical protein
VLPIDLALTETRIGKWRLLVGIIRVVSQGREAERLIEKQNRAKGEL